MAMSVSLQTHSKKQSKKTVSFGRPAKLFAYCSKILNNMERSIKVCGKLNLKLRVGYMYARMDEPNTIMETFTATAPNKGQGVMLLKLLMRKWSGTFIFCNRKTRRRLRLRAGDKKFGPSATVDHLRHNHLLMTMRFLSCGKGKVTDPERILFLHVSYPRC